MMEYPLQALRALIIAVVFTYLATVMVGLRVLARKMKRAVLGKDDCMIMVGLFLVYPDMTLLIISKPERSLSPSSADRIFLDVVGGGGGRHIWQIPNSHLELLLKVRTQLHWWL